MKPSLVNVQLALAMVLLVGSAAVSRAAAQAPDAPSVYGENCKKCHGVIGNPPKAMKAKFPKLPTFDAAFIASRSTDSIEKVLMKGIGKGDDMKSFKGTLTPAELVAVSVYVAELSKKH